MMFRKKPKVKSWEPKWGALRIEPTWNGKFNILEYGVSVEAMMCRSYNPHWHSICKDLPTIIEAENRIKHMKRMKDYLPVYPPIGLNL